MLERGLWALAYRKQSARDVLQLVELCAEIDALEMNYGGKTERLLEILDKRRKVNIPRRVGGCKIR